MAAAVKGAQPREPLAASLSLSRSVEGSAGEAKEKDPVRGHQRLPAESSTATLAWGPLGTPLRPRGVKSVSWKAATWLPPKLEGHTCKIPGLSLQPLLRNGHLQEGFSLAL